MKNSSHRFSRSEKPPHLRVQDFAAAIALTFMLFGLAVGLVLARLAGWGSTP